MKNVLKNFVYNAGYQILTILLPLITTPYLARIIGAYGIGQYSYTYSIAYYFGLFIMLGLNNYGNRTIASVRDDKKRLSSVFWELYSMQFFTGIVITVIYVLYCVWAGGKIFLQWVMLIYVIAAIIDVNWFFWGMEKFKFTTIRDAIIKILSTLLIFTFVKNENDLVIYVFISVFGILAGNVIMWPIIIKQLGKPKIKIKDSFKHLVPNLVLFIPIIAVSLYKVMDKIMLGKLTTMEQVGYYEYSEKIIQVPLAIVNALSIVMLPRMSNLVATNNSKNEKKYISLSIILVMFLTTSLCFGIMGIAKEFVPFFYGTGYEDCVNLFYILLPSCCFVGFASVIRTQYLIPHKEDKTYIISVFSGAVVNLILNFVLIPKLHAVGASIATLVSEILVCSYQAFAVAKEIEIYQYMKNSICFFIAGISMFYTLNKIYLPINNILERMLIKIIIGVICYFIYFIICIQFNSSEKKMLQNMLRGSKKSKVHDKEEA